jgi:hypothetical protein
VGASSFIVHVLLTSMRIFISLSTSLCTRCMTAM